MTAMWKGKNAAEATVVTAVACVRATRIDRPGDFDALVAAMSKMTLPRLISITFFAFFSDVPEIHGQLYEGSSCELDGRSGVCTILRQCTVVYNELLAGRPPENVCGYSNFDPIVCCPKAGESHPKPVTPSTTSTTTTTTTTARPKPQTFSERGGLSRSKCQEYARYVYQLQYPPVYIPDSQPVNISVCGVNSPPLIVGGEVANPTEFPHMVAIGYDTEEGIAWKCGGSLISENYVLSAAHCSHSPAWGAARWARVGDYNLARTDDNAKPQDFRIVKRIKNPNYKLPAWYHDIALFKLERNVEFDRYARPACLETTKIDLDENKATATGWGLVHWTHDVGSDTLLKVTLNLVEPLSCNRSFNDGTDDPKLTRGIVGDWQLCAGGEGKDTCQGDSGGPLVVWNNQHYCMYNIIGITSLGKLCGTRIPGVYTNVYNYIPWIESTVWGDED